MALAAIIGIPLKELGQKILVGGITTITSKIFGKVFDKLDPDEKNEKEIQEIIKDLDELKEAIDGISAQIEELKLDLKKDLVQIYVNDINSLFIELVLTLGRQEKARLEKHGAERAKNFDNAKQAVKELCEKAHATIFDKVNQLFSFVFESADKSILFLSNEGYLKDSNDFMSYFCKMKFVYAYYWTCEVKAVMLLTAAAKHPAIHFVAGQEIIDLVNTKIGQQEQFFNRIVSMQALAMAILQNPEPEHRTPITFRIKDNVTNVISPSPQGSVLTFGSESSEWYIAPVQSLKQPDINIRYAFHLTTGSGGDAIIPTQIPGPGKWLGYYFTAMSPDAGAGEWYLLPYAQGQCRLQYKSNLHDHPADGYYLSATNPFGKEIHMIGFEDGMKDEEGAQSFFVGV